MIVLFLSGPPGAGKDEIAKIITRELKQMPGIFRVAAPLRNAVVGLLGMGGRYEQDKDEPIPGLGAPTTPRELMIKLMLYLVKPVLGSRWLAEQAALRVDTAGLPLSIVVDIRDGAEMEQIIEWLEAEDVKRVTPRHWRFVCWHVHRPGHDFSKDIRSYARLDDVPVIHIHNDKDLAHLKVHVLDALDASGISFDA